MKKVPRVVRVDSLTWVDYSLPDAFPPVRLARLWIEEQTQATWVVVRFPVGWSRPVLGYYDAAEELLILGGSLEMNGVSIESGDHAWVPAGCLRADSRASECSALAWFSGPARWERGILPGTLALPEMTVTKSADRPFEETPFGSVGRCMRRTGTSSSWLIEGRSSIRADGSTRLEAYSLSDDVFVTVGPNEATPTLDGLTFVRSTTADHR